MKAEVVSIGTELLLGQIVDTDAAFISQRLAEIGIGVYRRATVGDNLERVTAAIKEALERADVVITIGGLGPTEDDLTREGIAAALGEPLIVDEAIAEQLKHLFESRGYPMTQSQYRQAQRLPSSKPIPNPHGTAPGLRVEKDGKILFALPGPPIEFKPMALEHVIPFLAQKTGGAVIRSRVLRIAGLGEAMVEDRVRDLLQSENPTVAPLAHTGEVHLRITARADQIAEADRLIAAREAELRERLGDFIYGIDEMRLEEAVAQLLWDRKQTLATAESCTGGLLGSRITDVSGSSEFFVGGVVSYSNALKMSLLGVSESTLREFGAVSEPTARAMAEGARTRLHAHWGIGITGIAGPEGGSPEKPVGLVYIGLADPETTVVKEFKFIGDRQAIKWRAAHSALILLRRGILADGCASFSQSS